MTHGAQPNSSPVGLIAGGGAMPFAVADSLAARGIQPVLFALRGTCDPKAVARYRHHWISIGQYGRAKKLFRSEDCRDLILIGTLARPALSEIRLDWSTLGVLRQVWAAFRGGDDHLLSGIGRGICDDPALVEGKKSWASACARLACSLSSLTGGRRRSPQDPRTREAHAHCRADRVIQAERRAT